MYLVFLCLLCSPTPAPPHHHHQNARARLTLRGPLVQPFFLGNVCPKKGCSKRIVASWHPDKNWQVFCMVVKTCQLYSVFFHWDYSMLFHVIPWAICPKVCNSWFPAVSRPTGIRYISQHGPVAVAMMRCALKTSGVVGQMALEESSICRWRFPILWGYPV